MPRIEERIDIDAPITDVFRFAHDVKHRPDWDERVVGAELLSKSPVRQGTLLSIDAGRGGMYSFSWEGEYSVFHFPNNSVLRVLDAAPSGYFKGGSETLQFTSVGGKTKVALIWEYEPGKLLNRLKDRLGGRSSVRRAIHRSLANLKVMIESR